MFIKKTFPIVGMTCASCVASVEKALTAQKGMVHADVNLATATAQVEYDPAIAMPADMKRAVQAKGYDMVITDEDATTDKIEALSKQHSQQLKQRTIIAIVCSLPLVIISMFMMDIPNGRYIMLALATPVVILSGRQFFIGAYRQAIHRTANMDTLVALSTGIAYLFSVFNTVYPQFWNNKGLDAPVYFEASAVVITFILLGKLLEERARSGTSTAIKKLMGLQPATVTRINDNEQETITIDQIGINDTILIRPGEKIAVDGMVVSGSSYIDESMLTGESIANFKETGNKVFAGTINQKGSFQYRADTLSTDTLLAQIIRRVQEAQGSKASVQHLVDKIASVFVPIVICIAVLSFIIWWIAGGETGITHGLLAMVTVLVIACPCALGLATPTAIIAGMGKGAENGILIKDAAILETAHKVNAVVLDKTGTITQGKPVVKWIIWAEGADEALLSSVIYSMEALSEHPLASAVTAYFKEKDTQNVTISFFDSITGSGVTALYQNNIYFIGSSKLLDTMNIKTHSSMEEQTTSYLEQGSTVVWVANQLSVLAAIVIDDTIKPTSNIAIKKLKNMGISIYMLTGDNVHTAAKIAQEAGIKDFVAGATPADKAAFVKKLQQEDKVVAMVGDGINDSEALAQADMSIAMGHGTDIAMDVAKMTIISSDLNQILKAIALSKRTVKIIRQNLFWAFIYNIIGIPIAAGILYPINGFLLNPMFAGAAMALSSVSVVSNSLRLKWVKI